MAVKGEAPPPFAPSDCRAAGWTSLFIFPEILPPEALNLHHSARPISSFMISLVPP